MDKRILLVPFFMFLFINIGLGLTKYGDAEVKKGNLIVVREGKVLLYDQADNKIPILKHDVLRVGKKSFVILSTVENTRIKMGANAVFQIRPWKQRKKVGYLRMLYGKIVFKTKRLLKKKRRFRFKTATATIGVKGTEAEVQVSSNANLRILSLEGEPTAQSNVGGSFVIPVNQVSFSIGGRTVTAPVIVALYSPPTEDSPGLDVAAPGAPGSTNVGSPDDIQGAGVDQKDLAKTNEEDVEAEESFGDTPLDKPPEDEVDEQDAEHQEDYEDSEDVENEDLEATKKDEEEDEEDEDEDEEDVVPSLGEITNKARQQSLIGIGRLKPNF